MTWKAKTGKDDFKGDIALATIAKYPVSGLLNLDDFVGRKTSSQFNLDIPIDRLYDAMHEYVVSCTTTAEKNPMAGLSVGYLRGVMENSEDRAALKARIQEPISMALQQEAAVDEETARWGDKDIRRTQFERFSHVYLDHQYTFEDVTDPLLNTEGVAVMDWSQLMARHIDGIASSIADSMMDGVETAVSAQRGR